MDILIEPVDDDEAEIVLDPQSDRPVPGFHAALVGMKVGEERVFRLPVPQDPAHEVEFTVQLQSLFDRIVPGADGGSL